MSWQVLPGDCLQQLTELDEASVDAIVTDPPYGINFMGKAWDGKAIAEAAKNAGGDHQKTRERSASMHAGSYDLSLTGNQAFQVWCQQWAEECLRVLKPGGHLLSFSGSRTYHRLACAVEDAGFQIRDQMMWLYGSGFPKSLDVSKAIDKAAGQEGEILHQYETGIGGVTMNGGRGQWKGMITHRAPATAEAERWNGWGTALKPAHEPIVVARKPLSGTVAENVLRFGTGVLNIDGCRICYEEGEVDFDQKQRQQNSDGAIGGAFGAASLVGTEIDKFKSSGRWPANVVLDEESGRLLDEQSGGQPSRFFYCAKASKGERNAGLDGFEERRKAQLAGASREDGELDDVSARYLSQPMANVHPTVKPIELMRYLCRLVTPPGGTVLDPFLGSGTTGCAAVLEGFDFIGIEREAEYVAICEARIAWWEKHRGEGLTDEVLKAAGVRDEVEQAGQLGLLDQAA